jgi:DNA-binding transcriptional MocR family regulator
VDDAVSLVGPASREGIVLAPGTVFRPRLEPSPWMRFNVATCDDPRLLRWLEAVAAGAGREG